MIFRISITCRAAEDSLVGCIGVLNQAAIMGACSVQILGIIFESSGQPLPDIDGILRSHSACSTGQRLHCPDDSKCDYSSSDKSALLRHRQRKHGYQAKPTASKDRHMTITKNRMASSGKPNNPSIDSSSSSPSENVINSSCPCCAPSVTSRQAYGAIDETDIWQGDHASPQATMTKQPVGSIERSLEGHVTSRFPVSFARTRLLHGPDNGPLAASKHCRCHTCTLRSIPALVAHPNSNGSNPVSRTRRGVKVKEVVIYKRVGYLVKESVSGHTPDKSSYHLSRVGRGLTGYSRVSSLICQ